MTLKLAPDVIKQFKDDYKMFSNFYPCIVYFEDYNYATIEHAFQAAKTKYPMLRIAIREAKTPGLAKRLGRKVPLRKDWDMVKLSIMRRLLMQKYSYESFKKLLISTGDSIIIEGNYWHDNYWGDCYCPKCKDIKGQNNLGKLTMKVREIVR